jgi:4-hydroxybutyrate CoA-transferase
MWDRGIPDAILPMLMDRKDLGVHTELISDNVIPLIEAGVINGQRKNMKPRKIILGFVLGTKPCSTLSTRIPSSSFIPRRTPTILAASPRTIAWWPSTRRCEVDLTGQVCAESIGTQFYSGIGGQLDFIRGAARSKYGKPIIALPSTAKGDSDLADRAAWLALGREC